MRYGAVRLLRLTGVARQRDAVLAVHQLERPLHAEALQEVWFMFLKWLFKGTSQRATPGAQESREVLPHSRSMDSDIEAAANLVARYYDPVPLVAVLAAIRAAGFVESTYFDANPDLRIHFTSTYRARLHFLATAKCERRLFPIDLNLDGLQLVRSLCVHDV
ncbi:MAG: hypothetical protein JSS43_07460 [Proteobacteria bacterium]|nr:hypothetical protein [Pseudomonadota bacterium]